MNRPQAKVPLILCAVATAGAVICFLSSRRGRPGLLWAGLGCSLLALICFLIALTRFLRNRSITSGLLLSTTVITVVYFVGTRFVATAIPRALANLTVASTETDLTNPPNNSIMTPVFLAQIGLFALWFLLILFIIYVYVRPIKKIDLLLGQILEAQEIKSLRLGKGQQYQKIAAKLQLLADEKYAQAVKRQVRQAQARARAQTKKDQQAELVTKIVKEQQKLPKPRPTA